MYTLTRTQGTHAHKHACVDAMYTRMHTQYPRTKAHNPHPSVAARAHAHTRAHAQTYAYTFTLFRTQARNRLELQLYDYLQESVMLD